LRGTEQCGAEGAVVAEDKVKSCNRNQKTEKSRAAVTTRLFELWLRGHAIR
jgi:hypothetical protein